MAVPPAAVAVTQARTVVPDPAAPFAPDPSWITVAGTGYRWTADGIALTAGAGLLAALIVLTLIPANTSGWTPGLRLMRLRVLTTAGTRAQLHHHLVRTVFGLVDLAPFVVPGLLGWYLAHRSPLHQRLGPDLTYAEHHPSKADGALQNVQDIAQQIVQLDLLQQATRQLLNPFSQLLMAKALLRKTGFWRRRFTDNTGANR